MLKNALAVIGAITVVNYGIKFGTHYFKTVTELETLRKQNDKK